MSCSCNPVAGSAKDTGTRKPVCGIHECCLPFNAYFHCCFFDTLRVWDRDWAPQTTASRTPNVRSFLPRVPIRSDIRSLRLCNEMWIEVRKHVPPFASEIIVITAGPPCFSLYNSWRRQDGHCSYDGTQRRAPSSRSIPRRCCMYAADRCVAFRAASKSAPSMPDIIW